MSSHTTDEPIVGGGIRSVNFFNGRLLTGEDLTREQMANDVARLRLGRALGSGVASGLEVSPAAASSNARPVVRVEAGIAVNREGRVLELAGAIDLSLARDRTDGSGPEVLFKDCRPLQPGAYTAGAGAFLLTIAPARRGEGRARVSGLGNEDAGCNIAFSIHGVQFRLWRLVLPLSFMDEPDRLQNRIAHLMLGTGDERRLAFEGDPLGTPVGPYGLLDDLRGTCLSDDQVPLAVLAWTATEGIRFVDLWSVRRRLVAPAADTRFPLLASDRRQAEAEAAFLQFQTQISEMLIRTGGLSAIAAGERFAFLPPVGMVPVTGPDSASGFDAGTFLGAQGSDELATLDATLLRPLIQESFWHDPIRVADDGERIQRYVVWHEDAGPLNVLVIARGTLPYRGTARFGRARFGRSRFAPSIT